MSDYQQLSLEEVEDFYTYAASELASVIEKYDSPKSFLKRVKHRLFGSENLISDEDKMNLREIRSTLSSLPAQYSVYKDFHAYYFWRHPPRTWPRDNTLLERVDSLSDSISEYLSSFDNTVERIKAFKALTKFHSIASSEVSQQVYEELRDNPPKFVNCYE